MQACRVCAGNLNDLKSPIARGETSRRQFKRDVTNADALAAEMAAFANSIIRNPILVSYIAKGLLPYRGLGSGITRALEDWPEIEFTDDRDGCLFTATAHRKALISSVEPEIDEETTESSPKSSQKITELMQIDPAITIADLVRSVGITDRAIKKQIEKLKAQ
ncbi:MAG: hypothetical protein WAV60_07845, partial [Anaerolineae bacterium]